MTDEKGIPWVDYKTLNGVTPGKQYNPTIVCIYAMDYAAKFKTHDDSSSLIRFMNCADWLLQHLTYRNDYALYVFNWKQPWYDSVGVPFTSGMTSGLAIKVFTQAYQLKRSNSYLDAANRLMKGFYVPIDSGGFTYKETDGWWFEELADTAMLSPRILDGHIFAITGLYEYIKTTKNDSARFIFDKGIESLKSKLPLYDIGDGGVYYDKYRSPADKKYHRTLTAQMKELYDITGDDFFLGYHEKWNKPLKRWYILRIMREGNISGIVLFSILCVSVMLLVKVITDAIRSRKA